MRNKKGQVSIEFILIILIALIYIYSVIQPTLQVSAHSAEDVARLSNVKLSAQKLAGTINQLEANASEGQRTLKLFVPKGSYIECITASPGIKFSATLSENLGAPTGCDNITGEVICEETISLLTGTTLSCDLGGAEPDKLEAIGGNLFETFVVKKGALGTSVEYVD